MPLNVVDDAKRTQLRIQTAPYDCYAQAIRESIIFRGVKEERPHP